MHCCRHVANGTALDELRVIARSNPGLLESVLHLLQHCQKPTVLASRFYPGMIPESPRSHSNSSASISTSIGCKRCLENEKRNFVAVPSADKNWHDFLVRFQAKIPRHMLGTHRNPYSNNIKHILRCNIVCRFRTWPSGAFGFKWLLHVSQPGEEGNRSKAGYSGEGKKAGRVGASG